MTAMVVIQLQPMAKFMSGSFVCHIKMEDALKYE
jgi:hypothetical protein